MNKSFLIIRRELAAYFSTWSGYIIIAAALLIDGLLFNAFALGSKEKFSAQVLADFFYFASGMSIVAGIFLAMRLIAEERSEGTIVLFYTSPITERQLIYGKFLSALAFGTILTLLSLYMPAMIFVNGKVSIGHIASGYLVLILLMAVSISMTLFASTLSPNQVTAAVLGAFICVTFLVLWMVSLVVEPPLKEIFSYLAIHNHHFTPFSQGIVHTKHVVFYVSMCLFFVECSVRALENRRWQG